MKRVLFFVLLLTVSASNAAEENVIFHEGVSRCVNLVDNIAELDNVDGSPVDKYIAKLTKELRVREYNQNCINVSTVPEVVKNLCNDTNSFCKTLKVIIIKDLVL